MKKIVVLLLMISFHTGFSQIYEAGVTLNAGNILGDDDYGLGGLLDVNFSPNNIGVVIKKNVNPRVAYRGTINNLSVGATSLYEFSLGAEFNFKKYNLLRYKLGERSTPYFILEAAMLAFNSGSGYTGTIALPVGIGYKRAITPKIVLSVEAKGRLALSDSLDNVSTNTSTLDSYYFFGASAYYTFGWPTNRKTRSRF